LLLKDQIETLNKDLGDRDTELQVLKKSKENHLPVDPNNDNKSLTKKIEELTVDNKMMSIKEQQLQSYNKKLESVVVSSRSTVSDLKQKVTKLEDAQKVWEEREKNFQNDIQASSAKIEDFQAKLAENMKAMEIMQEQVEKKKAAGAQESTDATTIVEIKERLKLEQKESKTKDNMLMELNKEIFALSGQLTSLRKQLKQKSIKVAKLESVLKEKSEVEKKLFAKVQALEKGEGEIKAHLEEIKAEKILLSQQLEVATEKSHKDDLNETMKTDHLNAIEQLECDKSKFYEQEKQLRHSIEELEKINNSLISEKEEITEKLEDFKQESAKRMRSIEEQFNESNASLERKVKFLEEEHRTKTSEVIKLIEQKEKLKTHVTELEKNDKVIKEELIIVKRKLSRIETEKMNLDQREISLERTNASMVENIKMLQHQLAQNNNEAHGSKMTLFAQETSSFESKLNEMTKEKKKLMEQLKNLTIHCDDIRFSLESRIKELKDTNSELVASKQILLETQAELENTINKLQINIHLLTEENTRLALVEKNKDELVSAKVAEVKAISDKYMDSEKAWTKHERELEQKLQDLQGRVQVLKEERKSLMIINVNDKTAMESQINELKLSISEEQKINETLRRNEHQWQKKINELKQHIAPLTNKNDLLNREYNQELELSERKFLEAEYNASDMHVKERQKLEKQIHELRNQVAFLTEGNLLLTSKNKDQLHSFEQQIFEFDQKMSEQHQSARQQIRLKENDIKALQRRVKTLTAENMEMNTKIKHQQEAFDNSERWHRDNTETCEREIEDLKERLHESKISERKMNNSLENMKTKMSKLNDDKYNLEKEKDYLFNKVKDHKYQMKAYADHDRKMKEKIRSLAQDLSTMKTEKQELAQEISRMITSFKTKSDLKDNSNKSSLSLSDELTFSLKKNTSFEVIEEDDTHDSLMIGCKDDDWRNGFWTISGDEFAVTNMELNDVNLHVSLQKLDYAMNTQLKRTDHQKHETRKLKQNTKQMIRALEEKLKKTEEENDYLQRELQRSYKILEDMKKEAQVSHNRSLEIENQAATLIDSWKKDMMTMQEKNNSLKAQLEEVTASKCELEKCLKEKETSEKQLKEKVTSLQLKHVQCNEDTEQNKMELNDTIKKLKAHVCRLEKDVSVKERIEEELNNEIHRLENELEIKAKSISDNRKAEKELTNQIKKAKEKISLLEESKSAVQQVLEETIMDKDNVEKIMGRKLENEKQEKNNILASKVSFMMMVMMSMLLLLLLLVVVACADKKSCYGST